MIPVLLGASVLITDLKICTSSKKKKKKGLFLDLSLVSVEPLTQIL